MNLTSENYYSREADLAYMSCSQYHGFLECEARQMAKLSGRWIDEPSEAFLVGNYFHTALESEEAHAAFCEGNFDVIFKTKTVKDKVTGLSAKQVTGKYAPYERADKMIAVARGDDLIRSFLEMEGEPEKIMHGLIFGIPWRIRVDKYVSGDGAMIIDWKTTANIWDTKYNPERGERETFIEAYGYLMRAAVYSEVEKQYSDREEDPHFIIVAISKQDYPDKEVLRLNHRQRYGYELEQIKDKLPRILAVKEGAMLPTRCGYCDYCRATKKLYAIKPYYKLIPEWRERREEEHEPGEMLVDAPQEAVVG